VVVVWEWDEEGRRRRGGEEGEGWMGGRIGRDEMRGWIEGRKVCWVWI